VGSQGGWNPTCGLDPNLCRGATVRVRSFAGRGGVVSRDELGRPRPPV
jgi:hypothetical protein